MFLVVALWIASSPLALMAPQEPPSTSIEAKAAPSEPLVNAEKTQSKSKKKDKKKIKHTWRARVMSGWSYRQKHPNEEQPGDPSNKMKFFLRQARLNVRARFRDKITIKGSFDLGDALGGSQDIPYLRDTWGNLRIHRSLQLRVGRFKRPVSRYALTNAYDFPLIRRGLFHRYSLDTDDRTKDLQWGMRGIGAMIWGKANSVAGRWRWKLSLTDPDLETKGMDVHARLEYEPKKWIGIGINGAYKRSEPNGIFINTWAFGGDLLFEFKGLRAIAEVQLAQDWRVSEAPFALGVNSLVSYRFELPKETAIELVAGAEWVDSNINFSQSEGLRAAGGLNLHWTPHVHLRPQVEIVRPLGQVTAFNPWVAAETYTLMFAFQI